MDEYNYASEFKLEVENNHTSDVYIENYDIEEKAVFVCIAVVAMSVSFSAIFSMRKTKKVPYAAKWLSTGLLSSDLIFILISTIRKFVTNPFVNLHLQTVGLIFLGLSHFTVALMSIERYILLLKPMLYLRTFSKRIIRKVSFLLWVFELCLGLFFRYGACYLKFKSGIIFEKASVCNVIVSSYYACLIVFVLTTSCTCYWGIFNCIQTKLRSGKEMSFVDTAKVMHSFRSTALVFTYLLVIIPTFFAYACIIVLIQLGKLRLTPLRLALEVVNMINCVIDPFLYAFWFEECRMYALKSVSHVFSRYRTVVNDMKMDIYNIPVARKECSNIDSIRTVSSDVNVHGH